MLLSRIAGRPDKRADRESETLRWLAGPNLDLTQPIPHVFELKVEIGDGAPECDQERDFSDQDGSAPARPPVLDPGPPPSRLFATA